MRKPTQAELDRFRSYVRIEENGCWIWTRSITTFGHGRFSFRPGWTTAHRFAYIQGRGDIPTDKELHHTCATPACVNPAHIEPVTRREHVHISPNSPSGQNARKTCCVKGHEFDEENTYRNKHKRRCRTCDRENQRLRKAKSRGPGWKRTRRNPLLTCPQCGRQITGRAAMNSHEAACLRRLLRTSNSRVGRRS